MNISKVARFNSSVNALLFLCLTFFQLAGCLTYPEASDQKLIDLRNVPEERLIDSWMLDEKYGVCNWGLGSHSPDECREEIVQRHPEWSALIRQAIEHPRLLKGMTKQQVLAATGWPLSIKIKKSLFGEEEQWATADGPAYLYLRNGRLVDWSEEEKLEFYDVPRIQADSRSILIPEIFNRMDTKG